MNRKEKFNTIIRICAACGKKIKVVLFPNGKYTSGHYLGKVPLLNRKIVEYWECQKCYEFGFVLGEEM
ncbi:MAG: hypothetical protein ABH807_01290 [Candidatus Shapirobacteria bacterium]